MRLESVGKVLLMAWVVGACDGEPRAPEGELEPRVVSTVRQEVQSSNRVLILGSSVTGGLNSREAQAVKAYAPTAQIDVVSPAQWSALTATQFMSYRAIIIGDAACQSGTAAFQVAIDNRATWGPIVDGDVVLIAGHPSGNNTPMLVENGIHFALSSMQYRTGMYLSLGCAYQSAEDETAVPLLEPFGTFKVQGLSTCADSEHMFEMFNDSISRDTWDGVLVGDDGCSTKTVFTSYPDRTFAFAAIATSWSDSPTPIPSQRLFLDYTVYPGFETSYVGTPYVLVRGAMPIGAGCGIPDSPQGEECDLGDGLNGAPNDGSQEPFGTCSWSCHFNWCGDGHVDVQFGEECDNGIQNGRTRDASGNIGTCSSFCKIPHVVTSRPPNALCRDVTVQATNTCGMNADINNGSNDPDDDLVGCTQSPAGPYNIGTVAVTLTCTDSKNNSATCMGNVTVTDKVLPVVTLTGPVNQSVECIKSGTYTEPGFRADDLCEGQLPQSSVTRTGAVSVGAPGLYTLSYQATDGSGNKSAIATRSVTVADTLAPVISVIGAVDQTYECGSTYVDPGATASDACDGNLTSAIVTSQTTNTSQPGVFNISYSVTDRAGHQTVSPTQRTVHVNDNLPPTLTISGPATMALECADPFTDPGATAYDACFGDVTARITKTGSVNNNAPGSYRLTYNVTDPVGQVAPPVQRTVNVSDTKKPVVTVSGPTTAVVECGSTYTDPGARASDACAGALPTVASTTVNPNVPGNYIINYKATDPSGNTDTSLNRTVTVADSLAPSLMLTGPADMQLECATAFNDPGATANDQCYGNLTSQIVRTGTLNNKLLNTPQTLTYNVKDPKNNAAPAVTRTVTVKDTVGPAVTVNGPLSQNVECGAAYSDPGASASDACAGTLPVTVNGPANANAPGNYDVTYSATDPSGNTTTSSSHRTVAVSDTLPPKLTVLGASPSAIECGSMYTDPGATASDQCAGNLTASISRSGSVNSQVPGPYALHYTVSDGNGHGVSADRSVNVVDTQAPAITVSGPLDDTFECGSTYVDPGATANDACAGPLPVTSTQTGSPNAPGNILFTYSATDPSGNTFTSPVTRTAHVNDNTPPTLALNGETFQTLECGTPFVELGATANDACVGDLTASIVRSGSVNSGVPNDYTLIYNVSDTAGNSAPSATRTVHVQDHTAPTIALNGDNPMMHECGVPYTDPGATAIDACQPSPALFLDFNGVNYTKEGNDYKVRYRAQDSYGNTSFVDRIVQVMDTLGPSISLVGAANVDIECGAQPDLGVRATDGCYGDLTRNVVATPAALPRVPGVYTVAYSVMDPAGHTAINGAVRHFTVVDTEPPTLVLNGEQFLNLECGSAYVDPGAVASDTCAGELGAVSQSGDVDPNRLGLYTVTYSVADLGNNIASVSRNVNVVDTGAPSLELLGPAEQSIQCSREPYRDPGARASDVCEGDLSSQVASEGTVNSQVPSIYTVAYSVEDSSENQAPSVSRTVTVIDDQPPRVSCPDPVIVEISEGGDAAVTPAAAVATDVCDPEVKVSGPDARRFPLGTTTVEYTAVDASGNTASCISKITVQLAAPPDTLIVSSPPDETEDTDALFSFDSTKPDVTYECSLDGADFTECLVSSSFTGLAEGGHTLQVRARDSAGRVDPTPASAAWTVVPVSMAQVDRDFLGGGRGCSSTGDGPSSLAMIGLGVLAVLVARERRVARLGGLCALLLCSRAAAQVQPVPSFELELLKLNPSGVGSLVLGTGELLPAGDYRLSLTTHYEHDPLVLFENGTRQGVVVRHRATAQLAAAYGLWGKVELGAQVPVLLLQRGDDLTAQGVGRPEGGVSLGTPLLTVRLKLLAEREQDPVDLALGVHAGPAVGSGSALSRELRATPSLMLGRRFGFLHAALDAGVLLRSHTILSPDANVQDEIGHALRLGAALATLGEGLRGELAVLASIPFGRSGSSVETLAGARLPVGDLLEAYGLAGLGYGNAPGTPDFRVLLGVAYGRTRSSCVMGASHEPGACPDLDDDGDGIKNRDDRCPREPGSMDNQGCPLEDTDSDGIADAADRCPAVPGMPALHGCPEPRDEPATDLDADDVPDEEDACPAEPGVAEMHGCPAKDTDNDSVQDDMDTCPAVAGPANNQGCPVAEKQLVAIQKDRIEIKDTVDFDFDKATIQPRSFPLLGQVARILVEHPEILSVTIEGHTDDRGSAEYNRDLSQRRAESVRNYLAEHGVARERMDPKGFGEDRPIQSNATDEGRAANRRVEFITRYTQGGP